MVVFCALFLLLSYGIGPFAQQAIQSTPCVKVDGARAAIPISHYIDKWPGSDILGLGNRGDIIRSISPSDSGNVSVTCPTGNCNFTAVNGITHSSAGLCSKCFDVSGSISVETTAGQGTIPAKLTRLIWPSGPVAGNAQPDASGHYSITTLNISVTSPRFSNYFESTYDAPPAETLVEETDETYRLANVSYAQLSILAMRQVFEYADPVGATCFLYPCVRSYHGSVENGAYTERLVSAEPMRVYYYPDEFDTPMVSYGL